MTTYQTKAVATTNDVVHEKGREKKICNRYIHSTIATTNDVVDYKITSFIERKGEKKNPKKKISTRKSIT